MEDGGCGFQKGGDTLKKFFVILLVVAALMTVGCSKEWYAHDTIYKTNDHMFFSLWGYENPTQEDATKSAEQGWWGEEIPVQTK